MSSYWMGTVGDKSCRSNAESFSDQKKKIQVRSFQTFAHIQKVIMFVNQTEGDLRESEWDEVKKL